jgi:hypothetical protein
MTLRRPRATPVDRSVHLDDFPALRDFLIGYLHEDFVADHGSPEGAVRAFARDADEGELQALKDDSSRFAARIDTWSWTDARRALRSLGGGWAPASRAALKSFLADIAKATIKN